MWSSETVRMPATFSAPWHRGVVRPRPYPRFAAEHATSHAKLTPARLPCMIKSSFESSSDSMELLKV